MKYPALLLLISCLLMGVTCERNTAPHPTLYGKTWLHSYEESGSEYQVYRPNTYDFPPSRGRTGFALEKDGTFRLYSIAPTDGLEEHKGEWKRVKANLLRVSFPGKDLDGFDLELISVEDDLLKVRKNISEKS